MVTKVKRLRGLRQAGYVLRRPTGGAVRPTARRCRRRSRRSSATLLKDIPADDVRMDAENQTQQARANHRPRCALCAQIEGTLNWPG